MRLVDGLIVDAGVRGHHVHLPQIADQLPFLGRFAGILPEPLGVRKIEAARVGRDGHLAARFRLREAAQMLEPAVAHHLDVAHHVHVGDGHEPFCVVELADRALELERAPDHFAALAAQHRPFLSSQSHTLWSVGCRVSS